MFWLLPPCRRLEIVVGGLTAEAVPVSERTLGLALHAAARIVLAVVGVELMPRVLSVEPAWLVILALMAGGIFFRFR